MTRPKQIAQAELSDLKQSVDLVALIRSRGVNLSPRGGGGRGSRSGSDGGSNGSGGEGQSQGKDLVGLCPFHPDKNPSLVVTPAKGLWHCFGCGAGGSVIDFLMKSQGISLSHAIELLRETKKDGGQLLFHSLSSRGPGRLPADPKLAKLFQENQLIQKKTVPCLPSPLSLEESCEDQKILLEVFSYYQSRLAKNPAALDFLKRRGLLNSEAELLSDDPLTAEMVRHFSLGVCDRSLGRRLPLRNRREGKQIRERLIRLGIYRETGREHFRGCLTLPISDEKNQILQAYGRRTEKGLKKSIPPHLYLKKPHQTFFHPKGLALAHQNDHGGSLILTEAILDALSFFRYGFQNVVSTFGALSHPPDLLHSILKSSICRIYLAHDSDPPGEKGAKDLADLFLAEGLEVFRCELPKGLDPNDLIQKALKVQEDPAQSLYLLLKNARWLGKRSLIQKPDLPDLPEFSLPLTPKTDLTRAPSLLIPLAAPAKGQDLPGLPDQTPSPGLSPTLAQEPGMNLAPGSDRASGSDLDPAPKEPLPEDAQILPSLRKESGKSSKGLPLGEPDAVWVDKEKEFLGYPPDPGFEAEVMGHSEVEQAALLAGLPKEMPKPKALEELLIRPNSGPGLRPDEEPAIEPRPKELGTRRDAKPQEEQKKSLSLPYQRQGEDLFMVLGNQDLSRMWRVRGLFKNQSPEVLKVNLMISSESTKSPGRFHVDSFDLYHSRNRATFLNQASLETGLCEDLLRLDLGRILRLLEEVLHEEAQKRYLAQEAAMLKSEESYKMSEEEKEEALAFLSHQDLLSLIQKDFDACGVAGEESGRLLAYLAATSRKLKKPLAVIIQSSSAAGKTSLMEAVLAFIPKEEKIKYAAMTGQSLFYMGEQDLKHKILAIVEEEGAEKAAYALKLLQSEGELTIASTGKDPKSGRMITQEYFVEGPVMIFMTTTALEIDEEFLNRALVICVDESEEQTKAIHRLQRSSQTLDGLLLHRQKEKICFKHQNAQRLLKPLYVINPHAKKLDFFSHKTRTRRDHMKYLSLIQTIALLFQYQRPVYSTTHLGEVVEYIEASLQDIELATRLFEEVLSPTLSDLPPQTRRVLEALHSYVKERSAILGIHPHEVVFSRREARMVVSCSETQLRLHLKRLVDLDHLLIRRGQNGVAYLYSLCFFGRLGESGNAEEIPEGPKPQAQGQIQAQAQTQPSRALPVEGWESENPAEGWDSGNLAGEKAHLAGTLRPPCGGLAATLPKDEARPDPLIHESLGDFSKDPARDFPKRISGAGQKTPLGHTDRRLYNGAGNTGFSQPGESSDFLRSLGLWGKE